MMKINKIISLILIASLLLNCAATYGGKIKIMNNQLKYPVSFTPFIHKDKNTIFYYKNENDRNGLIKVGEINYEYFSSIPKRGLEDALELQIGNVINQYVQKYGGDAVVNFQIIDVDSGPLNLSSEIPHLYYFTFGALGTIAGLFLRESPETKSASNVALTAGAIGSFLFLAYYLKWIPSNVKMKIKGDIVKFQ